MIEGRAGEDTPAGFHRFSGSGRFRQPFPLMGRQIDQPAAQCFELRRAVVVLDLLTVMRHRIDQPVAGQLALGDQMAQHAGARRKCQPKKQVSNPLQ